jgi:hypothetical protein
LGLSLRDTVQDRAGSGKAEGSVRRTFDKVSSGDAPGLEIDRNVFWTLQSSSSATVSVAPVCRSFSILLDAWQLIQELP